MIDSIFDRVSYHAVYDASILEALMYAKENGFAGVQVAVESPHLSFEELADSEVDAIRRFVEANGARLTLHAPDEAASLLQHSRYLREGILSYFRALFDFAETVHALGVTIHLGSIPIFPTDTRPGERLPRADVHLFHEAGRANLDTLTDMAAGRLVLCVENYRLDEGSLALLEPHLESGDLALCWDIAKGHGNPDLERFFRSNLQRVKQVHLHDIRFTGTGRRRSHRVIGSGEIDFASYFELFKQADVLDYCIEVRPREKAKESLEALKRMMLD